MENIKELNDQNFMTTIESEEIAVVDFYATWCGSCRIAAPMFARILAEKNLPLYKLEVEQNPKIKEMLTLEGLPSVGIFKKGNPVALLNTSKEEAFRDFLTENL